MKNEFITFELSKKGLPVIWEEGGGYSNTGEATIVADIEGQKKQCIFRRTSGHLACNRHGLFVLQEGDIYIKVRRWRSDYNINVYIVGSNFDMENKRVNIDKSYNFSDGEWDIEPASCWTGAIAAAMEKSRDYHCRSLYYGIVESKNNRNNIQPAEENKTASISSTTNDILKQHEAVHEEYPCSTPSKKLKTKLPAGEYIVDNNSTKILLSIDERGCVHDEHNNFLPLYPESVED